MAVEYCWRHPDRREVLITLYVALRMMHVPGRRRIAVLVERDGHTWCALEIAPEASERDARDWSLLFDRRYLVRTTRGELLARAQDFAEVYIDAGVAAFLAEHERQLERDAETRARWRNGG